MNKKIVIPIAVLAIILPAIGIMSIDTSNDVISGHIIGSSAGLTIPELVSSSDLTIEGTILKTSTVTKILEGDSPMVFTIAKVRVNEVLYGDLTEKTITVQMFGGIDGKYEITTDRLSVAENDQVIMILFKDTNADYLGGNYGLASMTDAIYKQDNGNAKSSNTSKSIPYDDLKEAIKRIQ